MTKILMVCMGNICRSPMAEVVARQMAASTGLSDKVTFASAGTHASHGGERPDPRAIATLIRRDYKVGKTRSRKVLLADFQNFDVILAMDNANLAELHRICPPEHAHKLALFLADVDGLAQSEVPDPYFGSTQGFERVMDLCETGARALIKRLG